MKKQHSLFFPKNYFLAVLICWTIMQDLSAQIPSFPGAEGFGAHATGGRGGQVVFVTNTNVSGPGSLQAALDMTGPRYIVFRCSGVIDGTVEVQAGHGDFTLAGQTSPHGIVVRGFLSYNNQDVSSNNFIVRHLRSRAGDSGLHPTSNWVSGDGITLGGVHNAIIDHCSFEHNADEAVDISRSSALSIQNCLLGETLGSHGYLGGMLVNYSETYNRLDSLSIHHNIWNRMGGRMPEFSCESPACRNHTLHAELSCNLFWDQQIETWYNSSITPSGNADSFYLDFNMVNNYSYSRNSYCNGMFAEQMLNIANNDLYVSGNEMNLYANYNDYELFYCCNDFCTNAPNTNPGTCTHLTSRHNYPAITYTTTNNILSYMSTQAGAFPRDSMDRRLMKSVQNTNINTLPVDEAGGDDAFLIANSTNDVPSDSDNDGMPDYWETLQGLNPSVQDHNGSNLSMALTGMNGYTNLECYLNCLSDALINGYSPTCGVTVGVKNIETVENQLKVFPNPVDTQLSIQLDSGIEEPIYIFNDLGQNILTLYPKGNSSLEINTKNWAKGLYILQLGNTSVKVVKQ